MKLSATILASAAALGLSACATTYEQPVAQAPAAPAEAHPRYSAEQFFETTRYSMADPDGFAFSPDGTKLLISSDEGGLGNAWALPLDGSPATRLTSADGSPLSALSYFPNDGRVLVSGDQGGNERNHVYVRAEDGSLTDLTPGDEVRAIFLRWSEDGEHFYVATNERDPAASDIYAYSTDDYSRELVFTNESALGFPVISSDGRYVVLPKTLSSADNDLYLVDLEQPGDPVLITEHEGNVSHGVQGYTHDNSKLVYSTDEHGEFSQVWTYDLATGEKAPLVTADWDVSFAQHSPSGRYRVSAVNADALTRLTILDTTSGEEVQLKGLAEGSIGSIRFTPDEKSFGFVLTSDTSPADLYVADIATGSTKRLTTALNPVIDESVLVEATVARFKSYDGLEIPGILYRPKGASAANPAPAVVLVHGGPGGQSRRGYSAMIQHLVNHGYAIYAINNRGSSGYGKTFFHLDDKRHGDADLRDVVASKAFLQGMDWIADDRIAIMGGSYGGYMTAAALTYYPDVFDAGINIFGVTNWLRTLESIPAWWGPNRAALYDELGDPATDRDRLYAISPLFHADRITKPLLVVQGANDPRVLQAESDELVAAVKANGVPVEYVLFPDEGHGFRVKANQITASEAYLGFLNEHIGN